jgi:hypothetical protein
MRRTNHGTAVGLLLVPGLLLLSTTAATGQKCFSYFDDLVGVTPDGRHGYVLYSDSFGNIMSQQMRDLSTGTTARWFSKDLSDSLMRRIREDSYLYGNPRPIILEYLNDEIAHRGLPDSTFVDPFDVATPEDFIRIDQSFFSPLDDAMAGIDEDREGSAERPTLFAQGFDSPLAGRFDSVVVDDTENGSISLRFVRDSRIAVRRIAYATLFNEPGLDRPEIEGVVFGTDYYVVVVVVFDSNGGSACDTVTYHRARAFRYPRGR